MVEDGGVMWDHLPSVDDEGGREGEGVEVGGGGRKEVEAEGGKGAEVEWEVV